MRLRAAIPAALLAAVGCIEAPVAESALFQRTAIDEFRPARGAPSPDSRPIFEQIEGKIGSHAATITVLSDGTLLAAWYAYDGPHELDGSAIYTSRRPTAAESWTPPELHIDRPVGDGNPVLYSEGSTVWLFQAVVPAGWSSAHIELQVSKDDSLTWSSPRALPGPIGANVRFPPVRAADGSLILPAYDDLLKRSVFYASGDGETWAITGSIESGTPDARPIQPSIARRDGAGLVAVMRNEGGDWLWAATSADDGRSWSAAERTAFPNPGSPTALLRLESGNHVLVLNDSRTKRSPLSVAISTDGCQTWSAARPIVEGAGRFDYPSVVQTADGQIHVVYSHDRAYIAHATMTEAWIAGD